MNRHWGSWIAQGFALPTVLIASVVLMIVLATSVQLTVATSASLQEQFYDRTVNLAAEAGIEHAESCLQANDFTPQWSNSSPLRPGSPCTGYAGGVCPVAGCYVASNSSLRTTYTVGSANSNITGAVSYTSTGSAERLRTSTGTAWRSYEAKVGHSSWFADGAKISAGGGWKGFGHYGTVVTPNGDLYGFGGNSVRQLNDSGTPTSISTPIKIALPEGVTKVKQSFTSGQGSLALCIITLSDDAYCRGEPMGGAGAFGGATSGWNKVEVPAGFKISQLVLDGYGSDGGCVVAYNGSTSNAYCFGKSNNGMLGGGDVSYTPLSAPVRFQLPAGLQAEKVWRHTVQTCVKATQGDLYCAGHDYSGQLTASGGDTPTPVRYNIPGGRKVKDVALQYHGDGSTIHVLTTDGLIWATGSYSNGTVTKDSNSGNTRNNNGNQPFLFSDYTRPIGGTILNIGSNRCIDNYTNSNAENNPLVIHDCNSQGAQAWIYDAETSRIMNATNGKCMSRLNNGTANGNAVVSRTCDLSGQQRWTISGNDIIDVTSGKCLDVPNGATANASPLGIWICSSGGQQDFSTSGLDNVWQGMIAGPSVICALRNGSGSGLVCSGNGTYGQLGNYLNATYADGAPCSSTNVAGTPLYYEMQLPPGEQIDSSKLSYEWSQQYDSIMVITKSGKVFGSGRDEFGKMGNGSTGDSANNFRRCNVVEFQMPEGVTAVDMSTRDEYTTYVVGSNGRVYAAGRNNNGQIGDGTTTTRTTPVPVVIPRVGFYF